MTQNELLDELWNLCHSGQTGDAIVEAASDMINEWAEESGHELPDIKEAKFVVDFDDDDDDEEDVDIDSDDD